MRNRVDQWVEDHALLLQIVAVLLACAPWPLMAFGMRWLWVLPSFLIPAGVLLWWTTAPDEKADDGDIQ